MVAAVTGAPEHAPPAYSVSGAAESGTDVATLPEIATGFPYASRDWSVTAPEHAPAETVRGAVVKASWLAAAATIVSVWLAGVTPLALAVTPTAPATVPLKKKVVVVAAAARVADVTGAVAQAASPYSVSPGADRDTGVGTVPEIATGFPNPSRDSTVTTPEHAPAAAVCAAVVKASWAAAAGTIVSVWLAGPRPAPVAVTPGDPATVPRKEKLPVVAAAAMVAAVTGAPVHPAPA
jgi:hypothetical protein